jgi:hypothetical protein
MSAGHVDDEGLTAGSHRGNTAEERRSAARQVAGAAWDAEDAARLLSMLGLDPVEGRDGTEKVA